MKEIRELAEKAKELKSEAEIESLIKNLAEIIDFEYFLFGLSIPKTVTTSSVLIQHNYPATWRQHYDDANFSCTDPIVIKSRDSYSPIIWEQLEDEAGLTEDNRIVLNEAKSYGLNTGFSIPLHVGASEFGMLSFASNDGSIVQRSTIADAIPVVQMVAPILQDAILRINRNRSTEENPKLTPREIETLTWAMEGKSAWEISQILGCTERTIGFHIANSIEKIGAVNRYQAISKALILGIIKPSIT